MSCKWGIFIGIIAPIIFTVVVWFIVYVWSAWEAHQYHSDDLVRWKKAMIRKIK